MLRRIGAVLAGIVVGAALALGTDAVLHATGVFPPWGQRVGDGLLMLATTYRAIFNVASGYVTAHLAPDRPIAHAVVLGTLGLVVGLAGAIATWNAGPAYEPHWYPVAVALISLPCSWAGGRIALAMTRSASPLRAGTTVE